MIVSLDGINLLENNMFCAHVKSIRFVQFCLLTNECCFIMQ